MYAIRSYYVPVLAQCVPGASVVRFATVEADEAVRLRRSMARSLVALAGPRAYRLGEDQLSLIAGLSAVGYLLGYNYFATIYYSTRITSYNVCYTKLLRAAVNGSKWRRRSLPCTVTKSLVRALAAQKRF